MRRTLILAVWVAASFAGAATFEEDFTTNPLGRGWSIFGRSDLFHWNAANGNLAVTWDSAQTNSYFYLLLGTILTRADDFGFALDLRLDDAVAGVTPTKPSTFPLAFGFQNMLQAQRTNFWRGTSRNSGDLVEFDYFPAAEDIEATVWPAMWSTNSVLNYNGSGDYTIIDLPLGVVLRIALGYTAADATLRTTITLDGVSIGQIHPVQLATNFTDFRVGAFSISSYSGAVQNPPFPGSVLAHGVVDNISITVPPPPASQITCVLTNGAARVSFVSRGLWLYTLERTLNFQTWSAASAAVTGNGTLLSLQDTNAVAGTAFYRVRAERP